MRITVVIAGAILLTVAGHAAGVELQPVIDPYLRIQQALNVDKLSGVNNDAAILVSESAKLGPKGASIEAAAEELAHASTLKTARAAFGKLGDAILIYAQQSDATLGSETKVAYCPMLRKYWLQKGDVIQNPFAGTLMSDCGRFEVTLPDVEDLANDLD